jgi:hypothetical protein
VPIARYFIIVGGTLAALMFIAGWCLPTPAARFADQPLAVDRVIIRIKSAHKWPEKSSWTPASRQWRRPPSRSLRRRSRSGYRLTTWEINRILRLWPS